MSKLITPLLTDVAAEIPQAYTQLHTFPLGSRLSVASITDTSIRSDPVAMAKVRHWCFTAYSLPEPDGSGFSVPDTHIDFVYCVYQAEQCPDTGRLHYQGYIEFKKQKTMSQVKALCTDNTMHLESRKGTRQEARAYCMKEDTRYPGAEFLEFGVWKDVAQGKRSDLDDIYKKVKEGRTCREIADAHPGSYMRYHKAIAHVRQLEVVDKPTREVDLSVMLMIGKPGTGKTRFAYSMSEEQGSTIWAVPVKAGKTLWFDNYQGEDIVLLDDFSGGMALDQFLRLVDRYPVQVEVKGGHIWWCPKRIIITTNVHPKDWWDYSKRADSLAAVKRRIHQVANFDNIVDGMPTLTDTKTFWPDTTAFDVIMGSNNM